MSTEPSTSPSERKRALWDIILTVILLVVTVIAASIASLFGLFLAFMSDSCGAVGECNIDQLGVGMALAVGGVWLAPVAAIVAAVVLLVLRRRAFWVALLGLVLVGAIWALGFALAAGAVGMQF